MVSRMARSDDVVRTVRAMRAIQPGEWPTVEDVKLQLRNRVDVQRALEAALMGLLVVSFVDAAGVRRLKVRDSRRV